MYIGVAQRAKFDTYFLPPKNIAYFLRLTKVRSANDHACHFCYKRF